MTEETESLRHENADRINESLSIFSRFWLFIFGKMFGRIKFFKKNVRLIEKYLSKGAVIHVFQYSSYLEYLILNYFLTKNNISAVPYPSTGIFVRLIRKLKSLIGKREIKIRPDNNVQIGEQYAIFLQKRGSYLSISAEKQVDEILHLLEVEKKTDVRLYLMPHITIWSRYPATMGNVNSIWEIFFGNSQQPGGLRRFIIFLRNFRSAFMRSGIPLDLSDWISDEFEKHGKDPIKEIRWRMFKFFTDERTAVTGPMTRPRTWVLESVLDTKEVREAIAEVAKLEERSIKDVKSEAAGILDFMMADYKYSFIVMMSWLLRKTLGRIYERIEIDEQGLEVVRDLLRQNKLVIYVPSHKSHADYLIWSWLLNENRIYPPHIIAGENMAFWPMGYLFRRMGALFMRRSFKGDILYATLLKRYLAHMLWEGYSVEFFIEGTRSRTGKMLMPKYGILSIYLDIFKMNPEREMVFVPVSLVYSKLLEESAHSSELSGGEKTKESTSSLLKLPNFLSRRYGALYIKVGDPLHVNSWLKDHNVQVDELEGETRSKTVKNIAYDIIYRINNATSVNASAVVSMALLTSSKKGVTQKKFLDYVEIILQYLKDRGAILEDNLQNSLWAINETLEQFKTEGSIKTHNIGNETIYTIADTKRHALDYYKNTILHFFAPASFLALAFSAKKKPKVYKKDLQEHYKFLSDLFRFEISREPGVSVDQAFDESLEYFKSAQIFSEDSAGNILSTDKTQTVLTPFTKLLVNFLESYWIVAISLPHLLGKRMTEKKFLKYLIDEGNKLALTGELEHGEATSKPNFQNAVLYFINKGIIIKHEEFEDTSVTVLTEGLLGDKKKAKKMVKKRMKLLELSEDFESKDVLEDLIEQIRSYLD